MGELESLAASSGSLCRIIINRPRWSADNLVCADRSRFDEGDVSLREAVNGNTHDESDAWLGDFRKSRMPTGFFDLAIGDGPPWPAWWSWSCSIADAS